MKSEVKKIDFIAVICFLIMISPFFMTAGTGDGSVLSVTKIVDNGPDNQRFNIVIMGDGYQSSEIAAFEAKAQAVVNAYNSEPAFGPCGSAVNFYRVNIASDDSGVDKPTACYAGSAVYRNTYLDTYYCAYGTQRCIWSSNTALVITTASNATSYWNFVVVLVNDTEYGGCAGSGMTFNATGTNFERIVMHELGHAIGNLADEYEEFSGTYSGSEPSRANITKETNRGAVKWYDLILETTPVPTWQKSDCTAFSNPPAAWNNIVGTYEGGNRSYTCGIYRPTPNCKMRSLNYNFCAVCARRIQKVLMVNYPGSNLSITPWGYFMDPKVSPYWQTPDIWCDNNSNGIQEADEPSIGKPDNHLFARVTNTGDATSGTFQVRFSYVPFTGVIDLANEQVIATVSRPSLGAGLTDEVEVLWDLTSVPPAFAGIDHFCVIVKIIAAECITYDNKAQNNFCNIPTVGPTPAPISFYIKNILDVDAVGAVVIEPRPASWQFTANVPNLENIPLRPKEEKLITINCKYRGTCKDKDEIVIKTANVINQPKTCTIGNFDYSFKLNNQILGGVSSQIIVHTPQYKFSLSIHGGFTLPIKNISYVYKGSYMFAVDWSYHFSPQLSAVALVGFNHFKAKPELKRIGNTHWWNISANLKWELTTSPTRPYINGGMGAYIPKVGPTKLGYNLGIGIDRTLTPTLVFELGADYHHILTSLEDPEFYTVHAGLIFRL